MASTPPLRILLAIALTLVVGLSTVALAQDDASDDSLDGTEHELGDDGDWDGEISGARVYGADRFSTAVAISQYEFPDGAREVYLAREDIVVDAVAAGPLSRGPILLVPSCGDLPTVVADEIARLHPRRVVALGGPPAVCDAILEAAIGVARDAEGSGDDDVSGDDAGSDDDGAEVEDHEGGEVEDHDGIGDDEPRTEETTFSDMAVGTQETFDAGEAGTVTITRTETGVELVQATAADGWTASPDSADPGAVEVRFFDGSTRVDFDAEVEDGRVRIRVRTQQD